MFWSLAAFFLAGVAATWVWRARSARLPPRPPSSPISHGKQFEAFALFSRELGPIISVGPRHAPMVVLNTLGAMRDLLEKSTNFASRPLWPMAELMGRQENVGFQRYSERHRRARKLLHGVLSAGALADEWGVLLDKQSKRLLRFLRDSPENFYSDAQTCVEELLVRFAYGEEHPAEYIKRSRSIVQETSIAMQPGKWLVNVMPALKHVPEWVPGAEFKRWASASRRALHAFTRESFLKVKRELANGCAPPSFVRRALMMSDYTPEEDSTIMSAAGSLFNAGTDTVSSTILTAILLLSRHPEIQARAHAELLASIGPTRLPDLRDQASLPYLDSVLQEVHRVNPAVPLVHRCAERAEEYIGYCIPPGTWVAGNIWAVMHDEGVYSQPDKFMPERFMPSDGRQPEPDPRTVIFGFGRRQCPGVRLANAFVFLVVARVLSAFELECVEPEGEGSAEFDVAPGLVPVPRPFRCEFRPRAGSGQMLDFELETHGA